MKELKLIDRVVVEIFAEQGNEFSYQLIAEQLHMIADAIEEGRKGGNWHDEDLTQLHGVDGVPMEVLWEHESKGYGGFKIGARSLIRDAYYGAKHTFEVCCVEREDLENRDFDTSKLTAEDMERIAAKAGDLILEGCDYWTGVVEAARYWNVPTKE